MCKITHNLKKIANFNNYKNYYALIAGNLFIIMAFVSRISVSIKSITLITGLLFILFDVISHKRWNKLKDIYTSQPIVICILLLFAAYVIGIFYSDAITKEKLHTLKLYLPLLFMGLMIYLFADKKWQPKIIKAFIFGVVLTCFLGILQYLHLINFIKLFHLGRIGKPPEYPFGTFSFTVCYACYLALKMSYQDKKFNYLYLGCFLFLSFFIMFINQERAAYVLFIALCMIYAYQEFEWKNLVITGLTVTLVVLSAYNFSNTFHTRTNKSFNAVKKYSQGNPRTSIGLRILFNKNSYVLWKEKPFFGYGTGSFESMYDTLHSYNAHARKGPLAQPHSEYAFIAVQLGLFGLLILLWLFANMLYNLKYLPSFERKCMQALTLLFMINCLVGTLFYYSISTGYYLLFTSLFYARYNKKSLT